MADVIIKISDTDQGCKLELLVDKLPSTPKDMTPALIISSLVGDVAKKLVSKGPVVKALLNAVNNYQGDNPQELDTLIESVFVAHNEDVSLLKQLGIGEPRN